MNTFTHPHRTDHPECKYSSLQTVEFTARFVKRAVPYIQTGGYSKRPAIQSHWVTLWYIQTFGYKQLTFYHYFTNNYSTGYKWMNMCLADYPCIYAYIVVLLLVQVLIVLFFCVWLSRWKISNPYNKPIISRFRHPASKMKPKTKCEFLLQRTAAYCGSLYTGRLVWSRYWCELWLKIKFKNNFGIVGIISPPTSAFWISFWVSFCKLRVKTEYRICLFYEMETLQN